MRALALLIVIGCRDHETPKPPPPPVVAPPPAPKGTVQPPSPVESLALGYGAGAVRLADHSTWTWGQASDQPPDFIAPFPVALPLDGANVLTAGSMSNVFCGVFPDATGKCVEHNFDRDNNTWGWSERKQWGRAPATEGLTGVVAIGPSFVFDCAVLANGSVRCWGEFNDHANDKHAVEHFKPVKIAGVSHAIDVGVSGLYACALLTDHHVACWGENASGALGVATSKVHERPAAAVVHGIDHVTQLAVGGSFTCVLRDDATVWCWGLAMDGQLGTGSAPEQETPAAVPNVTDVVELRAGDSAACVRHRDGTVTCWGNDLTSLETGPDHAKLPTKVAGIADAKMLAVGDHDACVVRNTGVVSCWGDPSTGVLGEAKKPELTDIRWLSPRSRDNDDKLDQVSAIWHHARRMEKRSHLGMAGHYAAMSEFLYRGYNVAVPAVDIGDDVYVVERAGKPGRPPIAHGTQRPTSSH